MPFDSLQKIYDMIADHPGVDFRRSFYDGPDFQQLFFVAAKGQLTVLVILIQSCPRFDRCRPDPEKIRPDLIDDMRRTFRVFFCQFFTANARHKINRKFDASGFDILSSRDFLLLRDALVDLLQNRI